ncbi:carbohydrate kinase [Agriterribacter sp.]|uniref:carbohydrate kinase family protein n=1 Tax=Agriterribacter sp. TaxID=2821509 RepID=UPI002CF69B71|nr:carbohydrate kinase [Agriterribacter sp.]HTN06001.1 carbohydrate kinase [Agriterribacter sp.]
MNNSDFTAVCFGEILWDILPDARLPGGAPMNVAYHLNQLQVPTAMISRIGNDALGEELLQFILLKGLDTAFIQKDEVYDTGTVLATLSGNNVSYEIIQPVAWDFIRYSAQVQKLVASARYFIFGSLVARNEKSGQTLFELLETAPYKILDINLRKPHYEKKVLEYLMQHADMLKLNTDELQLLGQWYGLSGSENEQMQALQQKFHLNTIITTRGDKGAAVLHDGAYVEHPGFKVQVADTIGSGDAFLAGFISKFIQPAAIPEALEFACRMGAFVAGHHGACPEYSAADIVSLA